MYVQTWIGIVNLMSGLPELCTIHEEEGMIYYIFYSTEGEFKDFKIELHE
jgi:hypothetical protein